MKLSRNDRSRVMLGALIALVIFVAAVSPAHCRSAALGACNDGNNDRATVDPVNRVTKKGEPDVIRQSERARRSFRQRG